MRSVFSACLGLLAMALVAPTFSRADDSVPDLPAEPKPGRYKVEVKFGGHDRTALVVVPKGYKPG